MHWAGPSAVERLGTPRVVAAVHVEHPGGLRAHPPVDVAHRVVVEPDRPQLARDQLRRGDRVAAIANDVAQRPDEGLVPARAVRQTLVRPLRDVVRYGNDPVAAPKLIPHELRPVRFDRNAMHDIDRWVRTKSTRMLYVYGGNDPVGRAEPFDCGRARPVQRQCSVHVVEGGTHGARIAQLPDAERLALIRIIQRWAGLAAEDTAVSQVERTGVPRSEGRLDRPEPRRLGVR